MKIAILNEVSLKDEHLKKLRELGKVIVYKNTHTEKEAIERLKDVDVVLVDAFVAPLNEKVLNSTEKLKLICSASIGVDQISLKTAKERKIKVANIPGFSAN